MWKIVLVIAVVLFALLSVSGCSREDEGALRGIQLPDIGIKGTLDYEPYANGRVSIPSVTGLYFNYDSQTQYVRFENPATNPCLLCISVYLSDGQLVYASDPIQPGDVLEEIQPLITLMPGIYKHSILVFDCLSETAPYSPLMRCEFEIEISVHEGVKG